MFPKKSSQLHIYIYCLKIGAVSTPASASFVRLLNHSCTIWTKNCSSTQPIDHRRMLYSYFFICYRVTFCDPRNIDCLVLSFQETIFFIMSFPARTLIAKVQAHWWTIVAFIGCDLAPMKMGRTSVFTAAKLPKILRVLDKQSKIYQGWNQTHRII